jgi:rRNA-processing protein FCF1
LQKVIFDSSFLMAVVERPTSWGADIQELIGKYDPVLLSCVKAELARLASGRGKKAKQAKVALALAGAFRAATCGKGRVDDEIVSSALSEGAAVATVDWELSQALAASHVRVISLRRGRIWAP